MSTQDTRPLTAEEIVRLRKLSDTWLRDKPFGPCESILKAEGPYEIPSLLDEIERLRAENERLRHIRRWNIERTDDGLRVCEGEHERSSSCQWVEYVPKNWAREEARREALQAVLDYVKDDTEIQPPEGLSPVLVVGADIAFRVVEEHVRKLMASPEPVAGKREARWIPVTERLPEVVPGRPYSEDVMTYNDRGYRGEDRVSADGKWQRHDTVHHGGLVVAKVTHWMPFPKPPAQESKED